MTQPNEIDNNAIGGTQPGTKSLEEIQAKVRIQVDTTRTLANVGTDIINAADWHLNTFSDPHSSPKYAVDPTVSYYGNGSLSLMSRLGKLTFGTNINEPTRGAFSLDQSQSVFYSSLNGTTLGSLAIDTIDGFILNPICATFPSTNFSPTKPWIKKLFPTLSSENLLRVAILELIQVALFKIIDNISGTQSDKESENFESKDIATIIQDNQALEDEILGL